MPSETPALPRGLQVRAAVPGARVLGVGGYRPRRSETNDELATRMDTSDAWIRARTGIAARGIAGDGESVVDMAEAAGAKALAAGGVDPADVDLVLVATSTLEFPMPQAAPQVAGRLGAGRGGRGAPDAGAYDVGAACAGFCYALEAAAAAVRTGSARHVLVVGSDRMTDVLAPDDRGTVPIFGDGAGAVVLGPAEVNGVGPVVWASDGRRGELITRAADAPVLAMQGPAVFRWATSEVAPLARAACAAAGVEPAALAALVAHQANLRIVDAVARGLGLPASTLVARDGERAGNTSAGSIPLAWEALAEAPGLPSGAPILLIGFGAGLAAAAQVVLTP